MYRVSPLTYFVSGILSVGLGNAGIVCVEKELLHFAPPANQSCCEFLQDFVDSQGGYLSVESTNSTTECIFCPGSDTNPFLWSVSAEYQDRWRNFGIVWAYVVVNVVAAIGLY
ncbi:ABC transporter [Corynespora cassiicola Philippines]|uniref:ABC transporter n=1 Tax=Corynespora cassiicola Philippines TaxID=1448308 RepID=A0A2T2N0R8_CORCC|nr:ABC transporter [Corynespora cassiicola Philippines]